MSVFSPGVENRLSALAASFMVRKAGALEALSRLTALDVLFVDSAQRNRLLRLQSALLAYLKSPADGLPRTRFLSSLRPVETFAESAHVIQHKRRSYPPRKRTMQPVTSQSVWQTVILCPANAKPLLATRLCTMETRNGKGFGCSYGLR